MLSVLAGRAHVPAFRRASRRHGERKQPSCGRLHPMSTSAKRPASDALARALDLLAAGDWQRAHEIVQEQKSVMGSWLHGIVHTLEGDLDNAQYWYRRAQREFPGPSAVPQEIAAARSALAEEHLA